MGRITRGEVNGRIMRGGVNGRGHEGCGQESAVSDSSSQQGSAWQIL